MIKNFDLKQIFSNATIEVNGEIYIFEPNHIFKRTGNLKTGDTDTKYGTYFIEIDGNNAILKTKDLEINGKSKHKIVFGLQSVEEESVIAINF